MSKIKFTNIYLIILYIVSAVVITALTTRYFLIDFKQTNKSPTLVLEKTVAHQVIVSPNKNLTIFNSNDKNNIIFFIKNPDWNLQDKEIIDFKLSMVGAQDLLFDSLYHEDKMNVFLPKKTTGKIDYITFQYSARSKKLELMEYNMGEP